MQLTLFGKSEPRQLSFALSEIKEEKVFSALRDYAEKVKAENHGYSRRLFAEESIRGFQFIEVLQNRFDVVLMNPPFGAASLPSKEYIDKTYPRTKNDVYAAFVERMLQLLNDKGFIGIISSRTGFFLSSFTKWREEILMKESSLHAVADFGFGVLEAMVETAAYTIEKTPATGRKAIFFRLLKDDVDVKGEKLLEGIQNTDSDKRFEVELDSFSFVPNTPFSYWVDNNIIRIFTKFSLFENEPQGRLTRCGLGTLDDFRFIRLHYEVNPLDINSKWVTYFHGGIYSPITDDFPLVVLWNKDGLEVKALVELKVGSASRKVQGEDHYFQPGFTFPRRTKAFSPKIMPSDGIYSTAGQAGFVYKNNLEWTVGILSSSIVNYLISISQGAGSGPQFEVGLIKRLPWPDVGEQDRLRLAELIRSIFVSKTLLLSTVETNRGFHIPTFSMYQKNTFLMSYKEYQIKSAEISKSVINDQNEINKISSRIYDIDDQNKTELESILGTENSYSDDNDIEFEENSYVEQEKQKSEDLAMDFISYILGCVYGRWDIRMALDKSLIPKLADPFDPLPVCSPGMLLSPDGYPATLGSIVSEAWLKRRVNVLDVPADVPNPTIADKDYPIQVDWDGILVDDEGHSDDIVKKVHEVLVLIYGEHADEREREILEILDVKSLRDYFRQPKRFFDFHIKRYSKSRRKAPIYWLLQTKKKNYGIWLYYHKVDNDTLFKILRNYVEPKLNLISSQILEVSQKVLNTDGRDKLTYEKELEKIEELRQEITEFKEEVEKVAKMDYDPNFDDGVILNMAPLHTVIPWSEPPKYWKDLESGKYDWAHIAMKYWPERVKAKCKTDKSLAIAHGYG